MTNKQNDFINSIKFVEKNGEKGKFLTMSLSWENFNEEAVKYINDKGYVNIAIFPRKEKGQYGNTHYGVYSTYGVNNSYNLEKDEKEEFVEKEDEEGIF